jgi:hypothetical protein
MRRILLLLLIMLISVAALWWIVRPGIFTVQLIAHIPHPFSVGKRTSPGGRFLHTGG